MTECLGLLGAWCSRKAPPSRWHLELRNEWRSQLAAHASAQQRPCGLLRRSRNRKEAGARVPEKAESWRPRGLEQPESGFGVCIGKPQEGFQQQVT